jgi:outer membrane protein TolC
MKKSATQFLAGYSMLIAMLTVTAALAGAQDPSANSPTADDGQTRSLEQCLDAAMLHAPVTRNIELLKQQHSLVEENISANWLPTLDLNGKASYQSDVVTIEIDNTSFPITFPEMPHDQYALNLDVRQTIYDGGLSQQARLYEQRKTEAAIQQVYVETYRVREQVALLYLAALAAEENRNNLEIILSSLKARENALLSAVTNGVASETDLQVIRVEILKVLHSLSETDAAKKGAIEMLTVYTGLDLGENDRRLKIGMPGEVKFK